MRLGSYVVRNQQVTGSSLTSALLGKPLTHTCLCL